MQYNQAIEMKGETIYMKFKRFWSLLIVTIMTITLLSACNAKEEEGVTENQAITGSEVEKGDGPIKPEELGSGTVKWSEEETADGYVLVTNEGGKTLGYSKESGIKIIQVNGFAFKDLNKNEMLDAYENWQLDTETRAKNLSTVIDIESIAGLMLYSGHQSEISNELNEEQIAFLDAGGRAVLNAASEADTKSAVQWNNAMQVYVEGTGFGIPVITSSDPREAGVSGVPSNLALAATFDPEIAKEMGKLTSTEYRLLGIGTLLGPQIDVTTEPRWNRTDGTFGDDPALSRDVTKAFVDGVQSTYDENGTDLGWGAESMVAMIKHWPGEGAGESGRESHSFRGNAQVFPGGQFETQLIPFVDGGFALDGQTEEALAVMSSYSIAYDEDEAYGELVGTTFSEYKVNDLLREQYGYDGVVCTDWGAIDNFEGFMQGKAYGLFDLPIGERALRAILAGVDQFGGNDDRGVVDEAYTLGVDELGEEFMRERFEESAVRLLRGIFAVGLFENPYVDMALAEATVQSEENIAKAYEAQLKSVVMLKNINNVIAENASEEKPTVYVPMIYVPYEKTYFGAVTKTEWKLPIELEILEKYFNVVTDTPATTLTGPADEDGKPTVATKDIVRATKAQLASCDYAFTMIKDPINEGNYFKGFGFDFVNEEYVPISLQYGEYIADSKFVRKESLSGDITKVEKSGGYVVQVVEEKENRTYYGKKAIVNNYEDVNTVKYAKENMPASAPVIVAIKADGPMIFSEIDAYADAIIIAFGMSIGSGYGVEEEVLVQVVAGKYEPTGLLPVQMPSDMLTVEEQLEDVPRDMRCYTDSEGNTYDFAFGMSWSGVISDERTAKYNVAPLVSPKN